MIRNVFLDRDGTIGRLIDITKPQSLVLFAETKPTIEKLKASGCRVFIVTNQSCIARGTDGGYDYAREFLDLGVDDWFICPHDAADQCDCRKPKPGLLRQAIRKYNLKIEECILVGDRETDVQCAHNMGMAAVLVGENRADTRADIIIPSLAELADSILI